MKEKLNSIRRSDQAVGKKKAVVYFAAVVLLGFLMGVLSKYSDTVPGNAGIYGAVMHGVSGITTEMGIWIFAASVIAIFSYKPVYAMINSSGYFLAMLSGYYLYCRYGCGFYSVRVITYWAAFAVVSSLCAWIVWYGRGSGWIADLFASLPIAVLFVLGHSLYHVIFLTRSITRLLDLIFAFLLILLFTVGNPISKSIRVFALALVIGLIVSRFHIISLLYGGF